jgi:alkylation response protein AidB-like acyl-CoA dehydrogenase
MTCCPMSPARRQRQEQRVALIEPMTFAAVNGRGSVLRGEGLFGLCVPERYGRLGADYETYCLAAEELAQGNASTALTFNKHCLTMLMAGMRTALPACFTP